MDPRWGNGLDALQGFRKYGGLDLCLDRRGSFWPQTVLRDGGASQLRNYRMSLEFRLCYSIFFDIYILHIYMSAIYTSYIDYAINTSHRCNGDVH